MNNKGSGRITSLDALRGFDMFWIIGGDVFFKTVLRAIHGSGFSGLAAQLDHRSWEGFTFYDLIFPLFLFIVGTAIPFSLSKRIERGDARKKIVWHIIIRTGLLFFLGLIYNGILDLQFESFRYAGVLQRIAFCYLIASILVIYLPVKKQAVGFGLILLVYWGILMFIPVPEFGAGNLTPQGNLVGFIDRKLLPGSFCCYGFGDNEGILSTLPAVATTLLGVLTGHWLKSDKKPIRKVRWIFIAGGACLIAGFIWGLFFPIIKNIWTSSYVLFAGGWSLLLLGIFYWIIDIRKHKKWAFPFIVIGMNPITIYVVQSIFDFGILVQAVFGGIAGTMGAFRPVFQVFAVLGVKWLFLYFLYRQKIFLKA